jgi:VIT1/CCC1 family predicted Fe2+/Mn2+ transporter
MNDKTKRILKHMLSAIILMISLLFGFASITCFVIGAPVMGVFYIMFSISIITLLFKKSKMNRIILAIFLLATLILGTFLNQIAPQEPEIVDQYLESHQI